MDRTYRILGIDSSTAHIGVAILDVDVVTNEVVIAYAGTYHSQRYLKQYAYIAETHGDRAARLHGYGEVFTGLFNHWNPHSVIIEQPFLKRYPQAYRALVESVQIIQTRLIAYNFNIPLLGVDPPSAKVAVGVSGRSNDKQEVMDAIKALPYVNYAKSIPVEDLDEHSCDAIAVGYYQFTQANGIKLNNN